MTASSLTGEALPSGPLLVWVFAPYLETTDPNLDYYSDYSQSHAEYQRVFTALGIEWRWELVTTGNFELTIDRVIRESKGRTPVVLNLCDGDEVNNVPGIDVIRRLDELGVCYTGADERFYEVTTSKIVMKNAFDAAGVPTPPWEVIPANAAGARGVLSRLGSPLIVKPAVSAGSMGITIKSVVHSAKALATEVRQLHDGYHGWNLTDGGVFAESFICGREFTTFIVGSCHSPSRRRVYPPVERVFHDALPPTEKFLSFDRLWEIYEREAPVGEQESLWQYAAAPRSLAKRISKLSWDAYVAVEGKGYGRVDLRYDDIADKLYVLEVNAQCGISEDEDYTSIGAILRFSRGSFSDVVRAILDDALADSAVYAPAIAS